MGVGKHGALLGRNKIETPSIQIDLYHPRFSSLTQKGEPNEVYTGVAIWYEGKIYSFSEVTKVYMMNLTDEEIENYIQTKEPMYVIFCFDNFS